MFNISKFKESEGKVHQDEDDIFKKLRDNARKKQSLLNDNGFKTKVSIILF